jgi:hypothetical protein
LARVADGGDAPLAERLHQLDSEWSANDVAQVATATLALSSLLRKSSARSNLASLIAGLALADSLRHRHSFLARIFQTFGFRDREEITCERNALKALRGDFVGTPTIQDVENRTDIERLEGEGGPVMDPDDAKLDPKDAARQLIHASHIRPEPER